MSALACWLKQKGVDVQGSDISEQFFSDTILNKNHIKVMRFDENNIQSDLDAVIYSPAYNENHPERTRARELNIPQFSYPEFLGMIFNKHFGVAVAGTHGKSTTAALIAHILEQTGNDPNAIIGAELLNWDSNARAGLSAGLAENSKYFVIEADEYKESFLNYKPKALLVTNIDWDHPDHFKTREHYIRAFQKLASQIDKNGFIVARPRDGALIKPYLTTQTLATYEPVDIETNYLFGNHNKENIGAALALVKQLGAGEEKAREAIKSFRGTRRRFEILFENKKIAIIDDYAHHPEEIKATLAGAKEKYPNRKIWCLFQPHTFTRTKYLLQDFAKSFEHADRVWITDIYASAREVAQEISAQDLIKEIKKYHDAADYWPFKEKPEKFLDNWDKKTPIAFLIMGAGDIFKIAYALKERILLNTKQ